jgi:hypothetical protein
MSISPAKQNDDHEPALHKQIASLAYALWEQRGCPDGTSDEDWFNAEKRLRSAGGGTQTSNDGATEDQMNMAGTVPPRVDGRGSRIEELAGTGEQDSRGG